METAAGPMERQAEQTGPIERQAESNGEAGLANWSNGEKPREEPREESVLCGEESVLCGEEPREEPREESVVCGDKAGPNGEAGLPNGQMKRQGLSRNWSNGEAAHTPSQSTLTLRSAWLTPCRRHGSHCVVGMAHTEVRVAHTVSRQHGPECATAP